MNILIVNDDGIRFDGIIRLAKMALEFGKVYVVAPAGQCSAMSQKVTVSGDMVLKKETFPIEGVEEAYSLTGSPADCVKVAMNSLFPGEIDIVFSGINEGFNAGFDTIYSGTIGAAMEAVVHGVPAIAYSLQSHCSYDVPEAYFSEVTRMVLKKDLEPGSIWNINFPGGLPEEIRGILFHRVPAHIEHYFDHYDQEETEEEGVWKITPRFLHPTEAESGTDLDALYRGFISIGKLKNMTFDCEKKAEAEADPALMDL